MKKTITILSIIGLFAVSIFADTINYSITVTKNGETSSSIITITNSAIVNKIIILATNKAPASTLAESIKLVSKNRLQEVINEYDESAARRASLIAAESAAASVLNEATSNKVSDIEK